VAPQLFTMASHCAATPVSGSASLGRLSGAVEVAPRKSSGAISWQAVMSAWCPHRFTRAASHCSIPLRDLRQATAASATFGLKAALKSAQRFDAQWSASPHIPSAVESGAAGQSAAAPMESSHFGAAAAFASFASFALASFPFAFNSAVARFSSSVGTRPSATGGFESPTAAVLACCRSATR